MKINCRFLGLMGYLGTGPRLHVWALQLEHLIGEWNARGKWAATVCVCVCDSPINKIYYYCDRATDKQNKQTNKAPLYTSKYIGDIFMCPVLKPAGKTYQNEVKFIFQHTANSNPNCNAAGLPWDPTPAPTVSCELWAVNCRRTEVRRPSGSHDNSARHVR